MEEIRLDRNNSFALALLRICEDVWNNSPGVNLNILENDNKGVTGVAQFTLDDISYTLDKLAIDVDELNDFIAYYVQSSLSAFLERDDYDQEQARAISVLSSGLLLQGILVGMEYSRDKSIELEKLLEGFE